LNKMQQCLTCALSLAIFSDKKFNPHSRLSKLTNYVSMILQLFDQLTITLLAFLLNRVYLEIRLFTKLTFG
jgi:hypothetical protein